MYFPFAAGFMFILYCQIGIILSMNQFHAVHPWTCIRNMRKSFEGNTAQIVFTHQCRSPVRRRKPYNAGDATYSELREWNSRELQQRLYTHVLATEKRERVGVWATDLPRSRSLPLSATGPDYQEFLKTINLAAATPGAPPPLLSTCSASPFFSPSLLMLCAFFFFYLGLYGEPSISVSIARVLLLIQHFCFCCVTAICFFLFLSNSPWVLSF